jgi:hypothetical protein
MVNCLRFARRCFVEDENVRFVRIGRLRPGRAASFDCMFIVYTSVFTRIEEGFTKVKSRWCGRGIGIEAWRG